MVLDMVAQNPCRRYMRNCPRVGCWTLHCPFNPPGRRPVSIPLLTGSRSHASLLSLSPILRTASGFYGNMNVIRAFWSTYYGQTKQHSHMMVSSTVTTATFGRSIIPM
jgi:hypothetical protein